MMKMHYFVHLATAATHQLSSVQLTGRLSYYQYRINKEFKGFSLIPALQTL